MNRLIKSLFNRWTSELIYELVDGVVLLLQVYARDNENCACRASGIVKPYCQPCRARRIARRIVELMNNETNDGPTSKTRV